MYSQRASDGSGGAKPVPQIRSGLSSLKRSWSGNQHDMGNTHLDASHDSETGTVTGPGPNLCLDWSESPSPPNASPGLAVSGREANKENAFEVISVKRAKSSTTGPSPLIASKIDSNTEFVTASTVYKSTRAEEDFVETSREAYAADRRAASVKAASSSTHKPSSHSKPLEFGLQFARDRKQAKAASLNTQNPPSSSISSYFSSGRSTSTPNMPWMKSAAQLRDEKKNDINGSGARLIINAPARTDQKEAGLGKVGSGDKITLSSEQRAVLNMVVQQGKNVFFTGSAGTGKSVLLREIIRELRIKHSKRLDSIAVTASTGIAACNIGGVTVHSYSGIGLGKEPASQLIFKVRKNPKAAARWLRTQVLIIDEISMVDPGLFDKLNEIAKVMKKRPDKPFGGIQVIITGDFFQLPPVNPEKINQALTFAFQAKSWEEVVENQVNLTQVFRQKDSSFVNMLNEMRYGQLSQKTIEAFKKLERVPKYDEDIVPTELFPLRTEVEQANSSRLRSLPTEAQTYVSIDGGSLPLDLRTKNLQSCMALPTLELKVGAQVMLIKNIDETLVNGSIGIVLDFLNEAEYNKTLEGFEESVKEERNKVIRVSQRKWPLVRFRLPNNGGTRDFLAAQESWKTELPNGEIQSSRTQVPLILAWAISIHKSQGQTLPCCKINLNKVFEKGQAYVALSRATSIEGLQVLGFRPEKVMAHPDVVSWTKSLKAAQQH